MKNDYKILGDVSIIYCYSRGSTIEVYIDSACLPLVSSIKGTWGIAREDNGKMYCKYELNPGRIYMHRLVTDCPEGLVPDHLDGNSLNNRLYNLEVTTVQRNHRNKTMYSTNTSGIQGVSPKNSRPGFWVAKVSTRELGVYKDKYEAGRAVCSERLLLGLRVNRTPIIITPYYY